MLKIQIFKLLTLKFWIVFYRSFFFMHTSSVVSTLRILQYYREATSFENNIITIDFAIISAIFVQRVLRLVFISWFEVFVTRSRTISFNVIWILIYSNWETFRLHLEETEARNFSIRVTTDSEAWINVQCLRRYRFYCIIIDVSR